MLQIASIFIARDCEFSGHADQGEERRRRAKGFHMAKSKLELIHSRIKGFVLGM